MRKTQTQGRNIRRADRFAPLRAARCPVDKLSASDADDKFAKANQRARWFIPRATPGSLWSMTPRGSAGGKTMQSATSGRSGNRGRDGEDLNARAFACTFKCIAGGGRAEGRGWKQGEREIDDLYCREVMDSADALTSRMKHWSRKVAGNCTRRAAGMRL